MNEITTNVLFLRNNRTLRLCGYLHCTLRKAEALCWSPVSPVTTQLYSPRSPMAAELIVNVPSPPIDALLLKSLKHETVENCGRRSREKKNSRRYLDLRDLRPLPQPGDHRLFPFGDAIEVNRLALHHGLVDGRNRQQSLAWNRRRERRRTWVERFNESARFQVSQASAGLQFGVSLVSLRLIYIYMYLYLESVNCNRFSVSFFFFFC